MNIYELLTKCKIKRNRYFYKGKCFSHIVWNYYHPEDPWEKGYVIHHKDRNSLNDNIDNLEKLTDSKHKSLHVLGVNNFWYGKDRSGEKNPMYGADRSGSNNPMFGKDRSGEKSPMFGKHHSAESNEKNRQAHLGLLVGERNGMYGKKGINNPNYGRKHTEEELQKMKKSKIKNKI